MVKMPKEVVDMVNDPESRSTLATVDAEGNPNVVPMGTFSAPDEETLAFAEVFLSKTKKNLETTKKAAVTAWKKMEGYQIKGAFQGFQTSGALFEQKKKMVKEKLNLDAKGVGTIKVEEVYIVSVGPDAGKKIA
jgi:hypothetical protein